MYIYSTTCPKCGEVISGVESNTREGAQHEVSVALVLHQEKCHYAEDNKPLIKVLWKKMSQLAHVRLRPRHR